MSGFQQRGEMLLAEALRLTLASPVEHDAVEHPGPVAGPVGGQASHRYLASTATGDANDRGLAPRGPGAGPGWSQRQSGLVDETDPRTQPARDSFTAGH